jgi:hypothetical protein
MCNAHRCSICCSSAASLAASAPNLRSRETHALKEAAYVSMRQHTEGYQRDVVQPLVFSPLVFSRETHALKEAVGQALKDIFDKCCESGSRTGA